MQRRLLVAESTCDEGVFLDALEGAGLRDALLQTGAGRGVLDVDLVLLLVEDARLHLLQIVQGLAGVEEHGVGVVGAGRAGQLLSVVGRQVQVATGEHSDLGGRVAGAVDVHEVVGLDQGSAVVEVVAGGTAGHVRLDGVLVALGLAHVLLEQVHLLHRNHTLGLGRESVVGQLWGRLVTLHARLEGALGHVGCPLLLTSIAFDRNGGCRRAQLNQAVSGLHRVVATPLGGVVAFVATRNLPIFLHV